MPDWKDMTIDGLRAERPDLVQTIETDVTTGLEEVIAAGEASLAESQRTPTPVTPAQPESKPEAVPAGLSEADRALVDGLRESNAVMTAELARLRGEKIVAATLQESDLSASGKILVAAHFAGAQDSPELPAALQAEIERVGAHERALMESARIPGVGGGTASAPDTFDPRVAIAETWGADKERE